MSELNVREATFDDKDDILNLVEFIDGLDYLHECFDFFQNCPNICSYVCEARNQIICYVACHRIDDGDTILTRAARVRQDYQGRGIYRHTLVEIEAMQRRKRIFQRSVVTALKPPARLNLQTYFPVATKEAHVFEFKRRQFMNTSVRLIKGFGETVQSLECIPEAYLSKPYSRYLFPEERMIVGSVPLRIIRSNLKEITGRNNRFASNVYINKCENQENVQNPPVKGLLTASSVYSTKDFVEFVLLLDVFGSNLDSLSNHVAFHLTRLGESKAEHVTLKVFTSNGCDSSIIDKTLSQFGINRIVEGPRFSSYNKLEAYEKRMQFDLKSVDKNSVHQYDKVKDEKMRNNLRRVKCRTPSKQRPRARASANGRDLLLYYAKLRARASANGRDLLLYYAKPIGKDYDLANIQLYYAKPRARANSNGRDVLLYYAKPMDKDEIYGSIIIPRVEEFFWIHCRLEFSGWICVGFVVCHRVDNGETILTRASRVRPEFQGKGVYRQMLMEIEEVQKEKGTARRYAVVKTRPPAMTQFQTYTSVARKEAHVFEIAEKQHVETSISDIKRIDGSLQKLEGIPALYLSEPYSNYLFPEGRIIVDLVPMRLIESNLNVNMSELNVREATFDDKDDIFNLFEFIDGLDYLHEYFEFFQNCPNICSYVCETRNQIVGFVVCHRVDNGETILTLASRIRSDFQGKGVYRQMLMEIEAVQKEKRTSRRYALVKTRPPAITHLQKYMSVARKEAEVFEIAEKQHLETYISDITGIDEILQKLEGIPAAYLSEPYSNYLFPEGRIIVDLVPMRLIESNLKLLSRGSTVFVSDVHINPSECNKLTLLDNPQVKGILTASSAYCTRDFTEMVLILDVFGRDLSNFNSHVACHLKRLSESTPQQVNFIIFSSKGCDSSVVDYTLGQFGIKKLTEGQRLEDYVKLEVYERALS
ncbi:uncharacterized protein LOC123555941 [Mercenaria mercenaria]|uniref:uncharacterized protein LOC123555941 n=1 Tax=Mercenaria mercenaria TaxID=6596 RepID=UPI00234EB48C|nr:uncharacterized protein LOC123555941 [Mercenaria mercenaria]